MDFHELDYVPSLRMILPAGRKRLNTLMYNYHGKSGLLSQVFGITDFQDYGTYSEYDITGKIGKITFGNDTVIGYTHAPL